MTGVCVCVYTSECMCLHFVCLHAPTVFERHAKSDIDLQVIKADFHVFFRPRKDSRLFVDEDEEKMPLVNGEKRTKRV